MTSPPDDDSAGETAFAEQRSHRTELDGRRALLFFVVVAALSVALGVLLVVPLGFYGSVLVSEICGFGAVTVLIGRYYDIGWQEWLGAAHIGRSFWWWSTVAVVAFAIVQSNIPVFLDQFFPIPEEQFDIFRQYLSAKSPSEFILLLAVAAVVPAIFEEVAFRGVIQTGLKRSYGPRAAIIWSGFLFAFLHLNPWNFIGLWSFGCLLGYLAERAGSIRPAIIVHMLNNGIALLVFSIQSPHEWEEPLEFIPWYWTLLAGVVLIGAIAKVHHLTSFENDSIPLNDVARPV